MKVLTLSTKVSVTRLGKISPLGRNFSREKIGWATFWAIFCGHWAIFFTKNGHPDVG
jgi:hypothetical protein